MYVYIKFESVPLVIKVISNVTISDDCGPEVDGKPIEESSAKGELACTSQGTIDAIAWFKSLPMEAVYIDCCTREAKWCPRPVTIIDVQMRPGRIKPQESVLLLNNSRLSQEVAFIPDGARPVYSGQANVMDFNPTVDEMFEHMEQLYSHWAELSERGEINREIARILHCYIFPSVMFQNEDIPILEECLRLVIRKQDAVEKEIVGVEKNIDVTDKFVTRQKDVLLHNKHMMTQTYLQACNVDFVDAFYVYVTKDIQRRNMDLNILQENINDLKKSREQNAGCLKELQQKRDAMFEKVQQLLNMREAIRCHHYRSFVPKKKARRQAKKLDENEASLHTCFLTAHWHLVGHKDHLKRLCYRKLHTASVREAIESTVKTLKHERPGSLGDFTEFSIHSGNQSSKRQWKSMQSRVDGWMSRKCSLNHLHLEGCQLIKDLVEGMLSDSQIATLGMEVPERDADDGGTLQDSGGGVMNGQESTRSQSAKDTEDEDISSKRAPMVRVVSEQVALHTWDMAERIVNRMHLDASPDSRHLNRAWVCYAPHFWGEAGQAVERVYTHYHAPRARQVFRQVSSAALADILDSRFFQEVFVQGMHRDSNNSGKSVSEISVADSDTISTVSLDLHRYSVSDLYALANKDGAMVNCHMMNLEMLTRSVSLEDDSAGIGAERNGGADLQCAVAMEDIHSKTNQQQQGSDTSSSSGASDVFDGESPSEHHCAPSDTNRSSGASDVFDEESPSEHHCAPSDTNRSSGASDTVDTENPSEHHSTTCGTIRSSQTVSSVLALFDFIVEPYHEKVQTVLQAPDILAKMQAVWQSVDFLSKKTGELCKARGMDQLLPMSIFTTASFPEELFVAYFVQLLILLDLRPSFSLHSMYDFSLTSAFSTFMFLFEARFSGPASAGQK